MSRRVLKELEELCSRLAIFKRGGDKSVEWGPYGYMLLNEIKSTWLSRSLNKHSNTYLLDALSSSDDWLTRFDLESFFRKGLLANNADDSFGIVSVTNEAWPSPRLRLPHKSRLFGDISSSMARTMLSMHRIEFKHAQAARDSVMYWQNERLDWWTKFLTRPENMKIEKMDDENDANDMSSSLVYRVSDDMSLTCETINFTDRLKQFANNATMISARTSAEHILECVLFDSIDFPAPEDDAELAKYGLKRRRSATSTNMGPKFSLDVSLAPYKLAIVYKRDDESVKSIAHDLKRLLYLGNVRGVLVYGVDDDREALRARHDLLDMHGVPYSVHLPSSVTKDGFCFVRNRETDLSEKAHLSNVVKHFRAILDSLLF